jgi:hypothetical protein
MEGDTLVLFKRNLGPPIASMYQKREKDLLGSLVTAGLGAGIITSFAVSQGQSPWVAMGITLFAATVAVIFDQFA